MNADAKALRLLMYILIGVVFLGGWQFWKLGRQIQDNDIRIGSICDAVTDLPRAMLGQDAARYTMSGAPGVAEYEEAYARACLRRR